MDASWQSSDRKLWLIVPLVSAGVISFFGNTAVAQTTPDQTLGKENSVVTPVSPNIDRIDGGAVRGSNLFHSFKDFNVGEGRRLDFANPNDVKNIFSRVTGKNRSDILGTLGVLGNANLFLLNPNGIIFGPNAKLDIRGSFVASTGKGVTFEDRILYGANNSGSKPLLTMAVPVGLQYGTQQAGDISNAGNLKVGQGQKLALTGGTVTTSGQLTAPGGTVHVLGERVGLVDNARIDVSGETGGGNVLIGGDFQGKGEVPNAKRTFVSSGASINADARTSGDGGRVIVWADETTGFNGNISARGGNQFGNGGFAEVSGKGFLDFAGSADLSAVNGKFGSLLLDPTNITIVEGGNNPSELAANNEFADFGVNNTINNNTINTATANVILQASNDITFNAPVNIAANGVGLTAEANNNINVNANIT
ncbi:MAG: filamentous hemagglutinin N-terminal domain-containing protein, partial [Cyanobacteria bacterium J06628_3]